MSSPRPASAPPTRPTRSLQTRLGRRPRRRCGRLFDRGRADHRGRILGARLSGAHPSIETGPRREPARSKLGDVFSRTCRRAPPAMRPARHRDARGEILYVIDAEAITRDPVPVVQVQWRTRKKNGEWGKPQPAPVAIADIQPARRTRSRGAGATHRRIERLSSRRAARPIPHARRFDSPGR